MARGRKGGGKGREGKRNTPVADAPFPRIQYVVVARAGTRVNRHAPRATRASLSLSLSLSISLLRLPSHNVAFALRVAYVTVAKSRANTDVNARTALFPPRETRLDAPLPRLHPMRRMH